MTIQLNLQKLQNQYKGAQKPPTSKAAKHRPRQHINVAKHPLETITNQQDKGGKASARASKGWRQSIRQMTTYATRTMRMKRPFIFKFLKN